MCKFFPVSGLLACALGLVTACSSQADPSGRAQGRTKSDRCTLSGSYEASGDWESFHTWSFGFVDGTLADSHTDDQTAEEWPTQLIVDSDQVSLIQVMHASDAIQETALHLQIERCDATGPVLSVVAAYSVFFDQTGEGDTDSITRHSVTLRKVDPTPADPDQAAVDAKVRQALEQRGLTGVSFEVPFAELSRQQDLANRVSFEDALSRALDSFLHDASDIESPLALVSEELDEIDDGCFQGTDAEAALVCVLNDSGELTLMPLGESPEGGESVEENWVFSLYIENLSDHGHWAIVDRADPNEPTFNYGFN